MPAVEGKASTAEQARVYLVALEREKEGYEARLASAKAGRTERLTQEQLGDRLKQVDAEIKRVKPASRAKHDDGE